MQGQIVNLALMAFADSGLHGLTRLCTALGVMVMLMIVISARGSGRKAIYSKPPEW